MMVRLRAVLALVRLVGDARKHTHAQHKRTRTQTRRCDRWQRRWRCLIMRCAACVFTATRAISRRARMEEALLTPHTPPAPHATADAGLLVHGMDTFRARLHTRSSTKQ